MAPISSFVTLAVAMLATSTNAIDFSYRFYEPSNDCDHATANLKTWPLNLLPPSGGYLNACNPAPPGVRWKRVETDFPAYPHQKVITYSNWNCTGDSYVSISGHCQREPGKAGIGSFVFKAPN